LRPLLDTNGDGVIIPQELHALWLKCGRWAAKHGKSLAPWPGDAEGGVGWLLTVCRQAYPPDLADAARREGLAELESLLSPLSREMADRRNALCSSFVPGTREWLFAEVDEWMALAAASGSGPGGGRRKVLVIEGGPGVGKSCFAAQLAARRPDEIRAVFFCRRARLGTGAGGGD
ncbi:MAG: hypothetical protein ACO26C_08015, partial [Ilumatobacteraceae bacterium]